MEPTADLSCPFCDYQPAHGLNPTLAAYDLSYHVEVLHREDGTEESPFQVRPSTPIGDSQNGPAEKHKATIRPQASSSTLNSSYGEEDMEYVECPQHCGETILYSMLDQHTALHQAETIALDELEGQHQPREPDQSHSRAAPLITTDAMDNDLHKRRSRERRRFKDLLPLPGRRGRSLTNVDDMPQARRLGKKELGPHAFEDEMPSWLYRQIRDGPRVTWINQVGPDGRLRRVERVVNETPGLIQALAELSQQDRTVSKAWLCSPGVRHIFKLPREGGFCGYRNIQMQVSWMHYHKWPGYEHFRSPNPNILDLQDMIEDAWDHGFNPTARAETGGVIGTRKYIGTPEVQALFQHLGFKCNAQAFTKNKLGKRKESVHSILFEYVLDYFAKGVRDVSQKVYVTQLPPIYFQHPGHSLTIVGLEVRKEGGVNLLVFDPMFATASSMLRYMDSAVQPAHPDKVLKAFRRGDDYLKKYKSFEILNLVGAMPSTSSP